MDTFVLILKNLWQILAEGGFFVLLGLLLAGFIDVLFRNKNLSKIFRGRTPIAVLKGVLFGAPIPVCCCGVVPVSIALKRGGTPRSALMSFLISTPETGIPSVLLTLALIGPMFTWLRPAVAVATAVTAGLLIAFVDKRARAKKQEIEGDCDVCSGEGEEEIENPYDEFRKDEEVGVGFWGKTKAYIKSSLRVGFIEILDDVAFWLVIGLIISAVIVALVPGDFLLGLNPWVAMLVALVAGLPMYMCASSTTPVAMALLAKGLAPGAALVFLLVGPATNIGAVALVNKFFGKRFTVVYLLCVAGVALAAGSILNIYMPTMEIETVVFDGGDVVSPWISGGFAVILICCLLISLFRTGLGVGLEEFRDQINTITFGWSNKLGRGIRIVFKWYIKRPVRRFGVTAIIMVLAFGLYTSCFAVPQGFEGYVFQFGKIEGEPRVPGLHGKWPWPVEKVELIPAERALKLNVGFHLKSSDPAMPFPPVGALDTEHDKALTLSADELLLEIPFSVRYKTNNARRYYYELTDGKELVQSIAEEAVRRVARTYNFGDILTLKRGEFEKECEAILRQDIQKENLGVELLAVHLVDAHPPAIAADSFRAVSDAQEDKARLVEVAKGNSITSLAVARGNAARVVAEAEKLKTEILSTAQGKAEAFAGLRAAYSVDPDITKLRLRVDSAKKSLVDSRKIIISSDAENPSLWLEL